MFPASSLIFSEAPEARQRVAHGVSRGVEDQKPTKPRQGQQIKLFNYFLPPLPGLEFPFDN
jgi:hypothetical protein